MYTHTHTYTHIINISASFILCFQKKLHFSCVSKNSPSSHLVQRHFIKSYCVLRRNVYKQLFFLRAKCHAVNSLNNTIYKPVALYTMVCVRACAIRWLLGHVVVICHISSSCDGHIMFLLHVLDHCSWDRFGSAKNGVIKGVGARPRHFLW